MDIKIAIGTRILQQRLMRGLSQEALASILGISRQSVSKWELGQAMPDIDKIVLLSQLWGIATDELLLDKPPTLLEPSNHILNWGLCLIVKNFPLSIQFYELLLNRRATILGPNRFSQFRFNGNCILSIMNEAHLGDHDYRGSGDYKFILNLWTMNLSKEYKRIKSLDIGPFTEISRHHPNYYFFNLVDPDYNLIEITGEYYEAGILSSCT